MKTIVAIFLIFITTSLSAQSQDYTTDNSKNSTYSQIDNIGFESYDEIFLFKNSNTNNALIKKYDCKTSTCVEKKYRHTGFSQQKCTMEAMTEKLSTSIYFQN
ncbi:MAG: hypothetical protein JXR53_15790 [Bacteroidales bacterium]|nr:hypothetical protein [Bacteroidales bacterium]